MESSTNSNAKELLNNKEVVEEINRHLWLESERVGYDIGFEKAAEDWLKRFSAAWINYHMPDKKKTSEPTQTKKTTVIKTRRASSYY